MNFNLYTKEGQKELPEFQLNTRLGDASLYIPSKGLADAVNVALALGQPLLLTGEPGTGKTQLAHHLAWHFKMDRPLIFNAQTTSTATDMFYKYDALAHFQYVQNSPKALTAHEIEVKFIHYQGLGAAIKSNQRQVVLIDEIDKAPRDLPNDVLAAIEDLEFTVFEIGKTFKTSNEKRPIIVMTSNSEKNLPDAFLRRVVYYNIPFPDKDALLEIVSSKVDGFKNGELEVVIRHFEKIRSDKSLKFKKAPATAELIFWTIVLKKVGFDVSQLDEFKKLGEEEKHKLMSTYSVLAKTKEDMKSLQQMLFGKAR